MKTIQINQCTQEDLEWLPGIGPATARKVVEARPIRDIKELEELIPPSAWLKVQDAGVEFDFEDGKKELPDEEKQEWRKAFAAVLQIEPSNLTDERIEKLKAKWEELWSEMPLQETSKPVEPPITLLQEPGPFTLRRVPTNGRLKPGAKYFCIWNVRWGPAGEAMSPADTPLQAEIEAWFNARGMGIVFAHFGRSRAIPTRNRGFVPLLLFEIIEETEETNGDNRAGQRN